MKTQLKLRKASKTPAFVARAERAFRRAVRALGLPLIVWEDGKVVKKPA